MSVLLKEAQCALVSWSSCSTGKERSGTEKMRSEDSWDLMDTVDHVGGHWTRWTIVADG